MGPSCNQITRIGTAEIKSISAVAFIPFHKRMLCAGQPHAAPAAKICGRELLANATATRARLNSEPAHGAYPTAVLDPGVPRYARESRRNRI